MRNCSAPAWAQPHTEGRAPTHYAGTRPFSSPIPLTEEHPVLEVFFSALLVLVCVGVLGFAVLTVKKLYQGQR